MISIAFLFIMVGSIAMRGTSAFKQSFVQIEIELAADAIDADNVKATRFGKFVKKALRSEFPEATSRKDKKKLYKLVSANAEYSVREQVEANPQLIGTRAKLWVRASSDVDMYLKGYVDVSLDESKRRLNDQQLKWISQLQQEDKIEIRFNTKFFTSGDSREPEQAGVLGAIIGSALSLLVCFILSFPLGVLAAVYLEEFAPKNRFSRIIEVNINNLAAVPSIVFGLLGLAIFLNFFGLPRSTPLVGGMVLALMTLPTIIIASRASLRAVPPSIREAAMGIGASKVQTTFHHVVPLAMPGMLTGSIIGMAQALGETAPLLMIGMVAFIVDVPQGITDAATALPVQIFLWADSPERGFLEKTSAAIMVLLVFLIVMNLVAIILRRRLEQRW
jgi:phosphate transport system permease protein